MGGRVCVYEETPDSPPGQWRTKLRITSVATAFQVTKTKLAVVWFFVFRLVRSRHTNFKARSTQNWFRKLGPGTQISIARRTLLWQWSTQHTAHGDGGAECTCDCVTILHPRRPPAHRTENHRVGCPVGPSRASNLGRRHLCLDGLGLRRQAD